jgi:hypothetical protein
VSATEADFRYWWTAEEWSHDGRTGATACIKNKVRSEWTWSVVRAGELVRNGTSTSQKSARAACRRAVRKLPTLASAKPGVL